MLSTVRNKRQTKHVRYDDITIIIVEPRCARDRNSWQTRRSNVTLGLICLCFWYFYGKNSADSAAEQRDCKMSAFNYRSSGRKPFSEKLDNNNNNGILLFQTVYTSFNEWGTLENAFLSPSTVHIINRLAAYTYNTSKVLNEKIILIRNGGDKT